MLFEVKTKAPEPAAPKLDRQSEIKSLLFKAVLLYIEENEDAKAELLAMLQGSEPAPVAS